VLPVLAALPALAADWNPRAAADYLDARQKEWFAWPGANGAAKPCVSCHTGATYLLARPALRRVLGETQPTEYETGLLASLSARVDRRQPSDLFPKMTEPHLSEATGVESIFAAWFLRTPAAFDRMWALQRPDGAWTWNSYDLDPWEEPESAYFGAALAALAVGNEYAKRPEAVRLRAYLEREFAAQPLHNRLTAVWARVVPSAGRKAALEDAWSKQASDGGWTLDALGPWKRHEKAPPVSGSNAYATAFAAAMLEKAGVPASDARLSRALGWLKSHQDAKGYWDAQSMNHSHAPDSMPAGFMRDAATAYAVLALAPEK
jgi:hypothetical protein